MFGYVYFGRHVSRPLPSAALRGFNVLLITIDTLRANRLGCYGSTGGLTPALDRLAAEGIRFETVYAHAPLTLPSHTSLFTGLYPLSHGVHDNGSFRVPASQGTLASALHDEGYRTAAFIGAFVLDSRFGLDHGFDLYEDDYGDKSSLSVFETVERPAEEVVAPAERWIKQASEKPWLAWLHLYDPHAPYEAPSSFRTKHSDDPYGAEIAYVDDVLGDFLERLRGSGVLNRTLVVVTADHGESLGEHSEMRHGVFAYDSTIRVPLLLWGDSLSPQVFSAPVRHVDLMPTLLDLLGVSVPTSIDGESLRPYLSGERSYVPRPAYFEALNTHLTRDWAPLRGLIRDGYKFIDLPIAELYDLERDPGERENLYERKQTHARELLEELGTLTRAAPPLLSASPDEESVERLRSLGYVTSPAGVRKSSYSEADDPKQLIGLTSLYEDAAESFRLGDTERAIACLRELVDSDPDSPEAYVALAYVLHESGKAEEAIRVLKEVPARLATSVSLQRLLGVYLLQGGDVEQAIGLLEEAVRRDPLPVEARIHLGVAYSIQGNYEAARSEFGAVLAAEPNSTGARVNLGMLELEMGRIDDAIAQFQLALGRDTRLASAWNGLGAAYLRSDDVESALTSWSRAVEIDAQQYDALYNLATTLAARNRTEAVPYLEQFTANAPAPVYSSEIREALRLLSDIQRSSPRR